VEMTQLRTFRMVAETLNFTRAAERLRINQSAVSHHIKSLETELGEPLFIRTKRGVRLSAAGKTALEYVERILGDVDALRERVSGRGQQPAGRVRAAAATQAFVHLFAPFFEDFMREHPLIELTFRTTSTTEQTVADIVDGSADVGFASMPVYSPNLQATALFEDELVLVVGRRHRLAGKRSAPVEQLARERFIMFERGASLRRAAERFFAEAGIQPELALESNDTFFIKWMVEHRMGVSLLPAWAVRDEVGAGRLAQLAVEGHRLRRSVKMISLGRFQPAATRRFLEFILDRKAELQALALPSPDDDAVV
jgi:DNA-binding transcriptional LysR family regulator